ncbi:uncharacterized protein LY89DRAFT_736696 [Mollisia scopiformis]|uniref:F-box domain-containing protein n=1 Tax=Mollisia scopiformis TaxID=149040 RepID=A0A194X1G6_MOLSC|nr:uncharacterized protein LY89DRAFT_736696 [Mollisia scopiformis]KUJ13692.1 hypothetical protein LY89DRAFT_736696 [Mollisia scopiformis]
MECLRRVFRVLSLSHDYPDPVKLNHELPRLNALEFSLLEKLPSELVVQIISYLPPESASMFAISCRPFYYMPRKQVLEPLQYGNGITMVVDHQRMIIEISSIKGATPAARIHGTTLSLLLKDFPFSTVCHLCGKLHSLASPEPICPSPQYPRPWRQCLVLDEIRKV